MIEQILDIIEKFFVEYLEENRIDYFIGGSRRFGYATNGSDIDIHVCITDFHKKAVFIDLLTQSAFRIEHDTSMLYHADTYNFKGLIHIIFQSSARQFNLISDDHDMLDEFISSNPSLCQQALEMKIKGCSGSEIYKTLQEIRVMTI